MNQHFHLAKQCQKIIGSCEPQLVPVEGFQEFGDIDLALTSILSLILYLVNQGEFLIPQDKKILSLGSLLDRLSAH